MNESYVSEYSPGFFKHWETFADDVSRAFANAGPVQPDRPIIEQQKQYILAISAVAKLLRHVNQGDPAVHEISDRFLQMAFALEDLTNGIPHPLFKAATDGKQGRPSDSTGVWIIRSTLCLSLEYLAAAGVDDGIALAVRKHRKQFEKLQRPNTDLKKSLASWRKGFASEQVANQIALRRYQYGVGVLNSDRQRLTDEKLRSTGENLLSQAAARAGVLPRV
jgi:hypothetical protein